MFIKQVIIQGFKKFRHQVVCGPFKKGHNVLVGGNGSGKTNFLYAIQFVLSDHFAQLSTDQRQFLLYKNDDIKALSAYVEIHFDVSEGPGPIENQGILLVRREISAEEDKYILNKDVVPRCEVMDFLFHETNFSSDNPYYIIQEGTINDIANNFDADGLTLLLGMRNTQSVNEQIDKSLAKLRRVERKVDKLEESVRTLKQWTNTLKKKRKHMKLQYRQHNKIRHALQYMVHEVELINSKKKLQDLEEAQKKCREQHEIHASNFKKAQDHVKTIRRTINDPEEALMWREEELESERHDLRNWMEAEKDARDEMNKHAKHLEKFTTQQNSLEQKIAESEEAINQLGALPTMELYTEYEQYSADDLLQELGITNTQLQKYSRAHKKANDQFRRFFNHMKKLQIRKKKLNKKGVKIKRSLSTLEETKLKSIQSNFKQLSNDFATVFKMLVPHGRAKLVMKTTGNEEGCEVEPNLNNFIGIGVLASFTKRNVEMVEMNELSGGQRSLVGLCLIFAFQKLDPSPFYLFDELDGGLEIEIREAVASVIRELSYEAQFFTTSLQSTGYPKMAIHYVDYLNFIGMIRAVDCDLPEGARDLVEDDQTP